MPLRPLGPATTPGIPISSLSQPLAAPQTPTGSRLRPLGPATGPGVPLDSVVGLPATGQPSTTGSRLRPLGSPQEPIAFKIGDLSLTQSQADLLDKDGDNSERLLLKIEKRRQAPETFGLERKQSWSSYGKEMVPFIVPGIVDKTRAVKDATINLESDERMDDEALDNLANVIVETELREAEDSQKGIIHQGLDLASQIPAFGAEFFATAGTAALAKTGAKIAAKKGVKALLPVLMKGALERAVGKVTNRFTSAAATAAIAGQIAPYVNPFKTQEAIANRMLPTVQDGKIVQGESEKDARFNTTVDNTIEFFTEQLGGEFLGKALGTLGKAVPKSVKNLSGVQAAIGVKTATAKWLGQKAGLKMPEAMKYLADKTNYHGVLGEMMEERYGEGIRAVSDAFLDTDLSQGGVGENLGIAAYDTLKGEYGDAADHFVGALAQLAVEGIGFSVPGLAGRAAGFGSKALGLNYEHTPEYARKWADANPEAAKQLAERDPQTLSRTFYASLGLPVTTGKPGREEFQDWVGQHGYDKAIEDDVNAYEEFLGNARKIDDQGDEGGIPTDVPQATGRVAELEQIGKSRNLTENEVQEYMQLRPDLYGGSQSPEQGTNPETTASVPTMVTRAMKQQLADLGYSPEEVRNMTPQQAHEAIGGKGKSGFRQQAPYTQDMPPDVNEAAANTDSIHRSERPEPKRMGAKPLWRDNILDSLESWQNKGDPKQLMAHLSKTKGTTEEAKWIGLEEFLADKKSVTREEVRKFVQENQVELKEVELGKPLDDDKAREMAVNDMRGVLGRGGYLSQSVEDSIDRWHEGKSTQADEDNIVEALTASGEQVKPKDFLRQAKEQGGGRTKYHTYTTPGGKNYRELLITKPGGSPAKTDAARQAFIEANHEYREALKRDATDDELGPLKAAKDEANRKFEAAEQAERGVYKSSHFDEPNILAHVRLNERTDEDGKKVLFIEEIQSDLHQEGREKGYKGDQRPLPDNIKIVPYEVVVKNTTTGAERTENRYNVEVDGRHVSGPFLTSKDAEDYAHERAGRRAVPNMPYKTSWAPLALRRMIRYAVDNGFDRIAWTPGSVQNERYDLSKQVDWLEYTTPEKSSSGIGSLKAYKNNGGQSAEQVYNVDSAPEDLADHVGKAVAEKLLAEKPDKYGVHILEGDGLRIGGKGMEGFYDSILPAEANKLIKKWGARVGKTKIAGKRESTEGWSAQREDESADGNGYTYTVYDAMGNAVAEVQAQTSIGAIAKVAGHDTIEAHSFDITPAMRSEAEQGMPLFAERKKPLGRSPTKKPALDSSQPDTDIGKKLAREMDKKDSKVGLRSITDMLANALQALYIRTKSQTSEKNPAHYRGKPLKDLPAIHAIFDRTNSAEINYHELGHAISSIFRDLNEDKYNAWQNYWKEALYQLSNDGFSSVPNSFEEGIAEALRLYLTDPGSLEDIKVQTNQGEKDFLYGFNQLLNMAPKEAGAVRDARRLYVKHRARSIVAQDLAMMNDKGLKTTGLGKSLHQKWLDWLTILYGMTAPIQRLRAKAYEDVGGGSQVGPVKWLWGMIRLLDPVYRQQQKDAAAATQEIVDKHDLPTAWNLVARLNAEVSRVFHGSQLKQKGLRIFTKKGGYLAIEFPEQDSNGNPMTTADWLKAMAGAGIPINLAATEEGDAMYLLNPKTGKPIPLYWEIKDAIGEKWDTFEVYGQMKTTLSRLDKHPDMRHPDEYAPDRVENMKKTVKELEAANPKFVEQYDNVTQLMDGLLSIGVLSGEIPVEDALRIKWSYEHYWPQERQKRDGSSSGLNPAYGEGKEIVWDSGIRRAFGSDLPFKRLDDIIHTRIAKSFAAYYNSKLFDTFLGFSKEVAKSDKLKGKFQEQVEWMQTAIPVGPDMEATNIDEESQKKIIKDWYDEKEAEELGISVEELREQGLGIEEKDIAISTPSRPMWTEVGPKMVNVVARTKGGRRQYYHIPDPFLFQIFKANPNLAAQAGVLGEALKWMGAFIVPFKGVLTRSLAFAFHNMFYRDPLTALTSGKSWLPLKYSYKGLKAMIHGYTGNQTQFEKEADEEAFTMYAQSTSPLHGFKDSAWNMLTEGLTHREGRPIEYNPDRIGWPRAVQSSISAAISVMLKPMDILNWSTGGWWLSPRGEAITRAGAFIDARERGLRMDQSLAAADNLTGNFNQRTHNKVMGGIDKQAMFLNARFQVGYQFIKQVLDPNPYVRGTAVLKLGYIGALHAGMVAASVLIARSLAQALGDDDWVEEWLKSEDERTDADKARMGTLPFGIPLRIPFDDGIPSMFASIGHNTAISFLNGHKERGETVDEAAAALWERVKGYVGADLSQLINPYLRTALEAKINLRLYNTSRIIPDGVAAVYEKKLQTTPSTPESYNELAEWLSKYQIQVSPLMLRHVVKNTGFRFADQWAAWADGRNAKEAADFPVLGQLFTQEPKGFSSQSVLSLQEMDRQFTATKKALIQAMNAGDEARRAEAAEKLISLQGYQQMYNQIEAQWKTTKKLKDAGRVEEAADMERLMTETARRGLRDVAIMRASQEQGGR